MGADEEKALEPQTTVIPWRPRELRGLRSMCALRQTPTLTRSRRTQCLSLPPPLRGFVPVLAPRQGPRQWCLSPQPKLCLVWDFRSWM